MAPSLPAYAIDAIREALPVFGRQIPGFDRDDAVYPSDREASDSWRMGQAGFSVHAKPSEKNNFTLQGDYYGGEENVSTGGTGDISGGNVLARWSHIFSDRSDMRLQLYYD